MAEQDKIKPPFSCKIMRRVGTLHRNFTMIDLILTMVKIMRNALAIDSISTPYQ